MPSKVYVDVDGVQGPFIINIRTEGAGQRRWNILVSQIECLNPSRGSKFSENKKIS
jgi:hypothetical protein